MIERLVFWLLEKFTKRDDHAIYWGDGNVATRRGYRFKSGNSLFIDGEWS